MATPVDKTLLRAVTVILFMSLIAVAQAGSTTVAPPPTAADDSNPSFNDFRRRGTGNNQWLFNTFSLIEVL